MDEKRVKLLRWAGILLLAYLLPAVALLLEELWTEDISAHVVALLLCHAWYAVVAVRMLQRKADTLLGAFLLVFPALLLAGLMAVIVMGWYILLVYGILLAWPSILGALGLAVVAALAAAACFRKKAPKSGSGFIVSLVAAALVMLSGVVKCFLGQYAVLAFQQFCVANTGFVLLKLLLIPRDLCLVAAMVLTGLSLLEKEQKTMPVQTEVAALAASAAMDGDEPANP